MSVPFSARVTSFHIKFSFVRKGTGGRFYGLFLFQWINSRRSERGSVLAASRAFRNRPRDPGEMLGVHICLLWKPQTPANRWQSAPGSPLCLLCFFLDLDGGCKIWDLIGNNIVPGKAHNLPSKGALHRLKMSVVVRPCLISCRVPLWKNSGWCLASTESSEGIRGWTAP